MVKINAKVNVFIAMRVIIFLSKLQKSIINFSVHLCMLSGEVMSLGSELRKQNIETWESVT